MRGFHGCMESASAIMKGYEIYYNFIRKHQGIKCCPYEFAIDVKLKEEGIPQSLTMGQPKEAVAPQA